MVLFFIYKYQEFHDKISKQDSQNKKEKFEQNNNCVCVFDIDNTITCSHDQAAAAIKECKKNNCNIAFNTARTVKYYKDLDLQSLGLTHDDFSHFYVGTHDKLDFLPTEGYLHEHIAETKVKHLDDIHKKFNTKKERVILFDDNLLNIETAKKNGFSTIFANNPVCGLGFEVVSDIRRILFR